MASMRITYDPECDAAHIYLTESGEVAHTDDALFPILIDRAADGTMLGIEILGARALLPAALQAQCGMDGDLCTETYFEPALVKRMRPTSIRVFWSDEDQQYVGVCNAYPSLSFLADQAVDAATGIEGIVRDLEAEYPQLNRMDLPEREREYSARTLAALRAGIDSAKAQIARGEPFKQLDMSEFAHDDDLSTLAPEAFDLTPEAMDRVVAELEYPRQPTQALIDLMRELDKG